MQIQWDDEPAQPAAQQQPFTIGGERQPAPRDPRVEQRDAARFDMDVREFQAEAEEREGDTARANAVRRNQITSSEGLLETIDQAIGEANPSTTGIVGSVMSNIPGTSARDFAGRLNPIVAALSFDRLQAMRDASPTGGALGQVSERELALLGSAVADLSQSQSNERVQENLQRVQTHYRNWLNTLREAEGLPAQVYDRPDLSAVSPVRSGSVVTRDGGEETPDEAAQRAQYEQVRQLVARGAPVDEIAAAVNRDGSLQFDPQDPAWQAYEAARQQEDFSPAEFDPIWTGREERNFEEAQIDPITSAALGTADMASFSFFDEMAPGSTQDMRAIQQAAQEQNPGAYGGGQIAGAFIGPAPLARTVPGAIAAGGAIGGLYGLGSAEGDIPERLPNAALGTAIGGATGGILQRYLPPAVEGVRRGAQNIVERADNSGLAQRGLVPGASRRTAERAAERESQQVSNAAIRGASEENIPLLPPDADPSLINRFGAAESSEQGQRVRDALLPTERAVRGRMNEIAPGAELPTGEAGEMLQTAGQRFIDRSRGTAGRLYERAERASLDVNVNPERTLARIDDEILRLQQSPNQNASEIAMLQGLRGDVAGGGSVRAFRDMRTNLRTSLRQNNLTATPAEARVTGILDTLNDDISTSIQRSGSPQAQAAWERADSFYRNRMGVINDVLTPILGRRNPAGEFTRSGEQVAARFRNMSRTDSRRFAGMLSKLSPDERADIAATTLAQMGRSRNGNFSLNFLVNNLGGGDGSMSQAAIRALYGADGAKAIGNLVDIARARQRTMSGINNSRSGAVRNTGDSASSFRRDFNNALFFGGGAAATTGSVTAGAIAAGIGGSVGNRIRSALERRAQAGDIALLTDPNFVRLLQNAPEANSAANAYVARLNRYVAANDNSSIPFIQGVAADDAHDPGHEIEQQNER